MLCRRALGDRVIDPADLFGVEVDHILADVMGAPPPAARLAVLEQAGRGPQPGHVIRGSAYG